MIDFDFLPRYFRFGGHKFFDPFSFITEQNELKVRIFCKLATE